MVFGDVVGVFLELVTDPHWPAMFTGPYAPWVITAGHVIAYVFFCHHYRLLRPDMVASISS